MVDLLRRRPPVSPADAAAARNRRRFARRQWRRRWLAWKYVVAALLVLLLVVGGVWLVLFSRYLAVEEVSVSGTRMLSASDVRSAAGVPTGEPLARVDLEAVQRRVQALPAVAEATVTRGWPDAVRIAVTERQAIAVVELGDRIRGMDAGGVLFRDYARAPRGLPLVRTSGTVESDALEEAAAVVSALPPSLARRVRYVSVESVDQIALVLRDGRVVLWGSSEESDVKAQVVAQLLGSVQARLYDVSVPGQPTTSPTVSPDLLPE